MHSSRPVRSLKILHRDDYNTKDPKFKISDHVRILNDKNVFAKGYVLYWSEGFFIISKITNTVLWTYVTNYINGEEIIGTFNEKELQKANQEEFRTEKVIKRQENKLYVKWRGYGNLFNSWIEEKDIL